MVARTFCWYAYRVGAKSDGIVDMQVIGRARKEECVGGGMGLLNVAPVPIMELCRGRDFIHQDKVRRNMCLQR